MNTVFLTVFAGVLTYVVGQIIVKLVIEPVQNYSKTVGLISHALIEWAPAIHNPGVLPLDKSHEAHDVLRNLASELQAHLYLVPGYKTTAAIFRLPTREKVLDACSAMIGLANGVYRPSALDVNLRRQETVCDALKIYLPPDSRPLSPDKV